MTSSSSTSLNDTLASLPALSTLVKAIMAAELTETLGGKDVYTVFAPNNDAFAKIPSADLTSLLTPEKKKALSEIIMNHVCKGILLSSDLRDGDEIKTLSGTARISIKDKKVGIGKSTVLSADIHATNGVIHIIDTVLLP